MWLAINLDRTAESSVACRLKGLATATFPCDVPCFVLDAFATTSAVPNQDCRRRNDYDVRILVRFFDVFFCLFDFSSLYIVVQH